MPELPEVETVRRGLAAVWEGRRLIGVQLRRDGLRRPFPRDFAARLEGLRISSVGRRAKYLLVRFEDGPVLLGHLGMSGRMVIGRQGERQPGPHDHVLFTTEDGTLVTYADPRRFGLMDVCLPSELATHRLLADLGPEPLDDAFTAEVLGRALMGRNQPIKTALLDQTRVAGLGNIYVCESLFRAGISPVRPAGSLGRGELELLTRTIKAVLAEAILAGGSSLRDHVRPDGELGYFQHRFAVYGREGEACPDCTCGAPPGGGIRRMAQGGRSTFYCAIRQS